MQPDRYDGGMTAGMLEIVWLPRNHVVDVLGRVGSEPLVRGFEVHADPAKGWTLNELLRLPAPGGDIIRPTHVHLQQAAGGVWMMAAHEGVLYVSQWIHGQAAHAGGYGSRPAPGLDGTPRAVAAQLATAAEQRANHHSPVWGYHL
ncbi:hypothetical protein [Deinococcus sp. QL22]|uniref:hypothetical protein n=1 Tax=Deinococcus sp. QL22 TaxID=2939437 RepID=UPI002016C055|nr:hypothetical protein [Deinococcus sp. QL22]UQN09071.1 hypothetical protein M1R55_23765 [Deinococcus sp. QL22]